MMEIYDSEAETITKEIKIYFDQFMKEDIKKEVEEVDKNDTNRLRPLQIQYI